MSTNEDTIPAHYVQGFRANLNLVPQQMESRLLGAVDTDLSFSEPGKSFNADDLGISTPQRVVTRVPDSPEGFLANTRRGGHFEAFADGKFIDDLDKARMLSDPSNKTMQAMMAGKNRFMDDKIIDVMFGTAYSGETLVTANSFPAGQVIAVDSRANLHDAETVAGSGDLPLTVGKIITAGELLDQSEIEGERYFAIGSKQKSQLLASTPVTSADYNAVKALVAGQINELYGFRFIRTERLPVASSIRSCAAWIKPAVMYRARTIQNAWIDRRKDKSGRWYAYYEMEHAGVRHLDGGVVKVLCSEA